MDKRETETENDPVGCTRTRNGRKKPCVAPGGAGIKSWSSSVSVGRVALLRMAVESTRCDPRPGDIIHGNKTDTSLLTRRAGGSDVASREIKSAYARTRPLRPRTGEFEARRQGQPLRHTCDPENSCSQGDKVARSFRLDRGGARGRRVECMKHKARSGRTTRSGAGDSGCGVVQVLGFVHRLAVARPFAGCSWGWALGSLLVPLLPAAWVVRCAGCQAASCTTTSTGGRLARTPSTRPPPSPDRQGHSPRCDRTRVLL